MLPLLGGALAHGICMRQGWLAFLARPIDRGLRVRGRPLFGASKTWRGPILVGCGAAAVWVLQQRVLHRLPGCAALELVDYSSLPGWWFGAAAGAVAELAELPNSFTKRQLGIAPGGTARGPLAAVFFLWDQVDVLLGFWLVLSAVVPVTLPRVLVSLAIVACLHPALTVIGYALRMRPTPR